MKKFLLFLFISFCPISEGSFLPESKAIDRLYEESVFVKQMLKEELIDEVNKYIKSVAPSSLVTAEFLVERCIQYEIDITFVLAQGLLESHFATRGIGGRINSIFNVCVYDSVSSGDSSVPKAHRYLHPDESIEPYLQLLRDDYLVEGKNERDLLNNYVNKNGHRYASNPLYEEQITSMIKRIQRTTKIDSLWQEYNSVI